MDFMLKGIYIELDNLLKAAGMVASGAQAKACIQAGSLKVNGEVETRVRRKLHAGDIVELSGNTITIIGS